MNIERKEEIKKYIAENGEVQLRELEKKYPQVSSMTLRRDLTDLENNGFVVRTRGGARSISKVLSNGEETYNLRANENTDAKIKIAKKALEFLENGRSTFIDSGTTTMCLAKLLPDEYLSILTSGPNIALEIIKKNNPSITLIGGQLSRNNLTTSGANSVDFVKSINIDIAFMAASGFSLKSGFTIGNYNECELKKSVIKKARKVILLIDSSKLDKSMPYTFATLKDIDIIICEKQLPDAFIKIIEKNGIIVL